MINDQADEATEELFQPLLFRYQIRLEISIRASDFILDCVHLFYCKSHKTNSKRGGSYIDSPHWTKNQQ